MSVIGELMSVCELLRIVREAHRSVEGNKHRCNLLLIRCENIGEIVSKIRDQDSNVVKKMLQDLTKTMDDCATFMKEYGKPGWKRFILRVLDFQKIEKTFRELNERLSSALQLLQIAKDVADEQIHRANLNDIKDQVNLIAEMVHDLKSNINCSQGNLAEYSLSVGQNQAIDTLFRENTATLETKQTLLELIHDDRPTAEKITAYEAILQRLQVRVQVGEDIGTGSFGAVTVHKGKLNRLDVAVKKFDKILRNATANDIKAIKREALIMSMIDHPNVIKFLGITLTSGLLVMELAYGSLFEIIHGRKPLPSNLSMLDTKVKISWLLDTAIAIQYLHIHDIIHRDVKSQNILLVITPGGKVIAKLADFGVAVAVGFTLSTSTASARMATEAVGSKRYMAPELMLAEPPEQIVYSPAVDVYAMGITANEVFTKQIPYANMSDIQILNAMIARRRPSPFVPSGTVETKLLKLIGDANTGCLADCSKRHSSLEVKEILTSLYAECCYERRTHGSGDVYEGSVVDNKRHGRGKYIWANQSTYEGDFFDDKMTGQGTKRSVDGSVYVGAWLNGQRHGYGELTHSTGCYAGMWVNDLKHGKGKFTNATDRTVYEGDFTKDTITGIGCKTYVNNDIYQGEWRDNKRHGKGTFTCKNGEVLSGTWKDDKLHGNGTKKFNDGSIYEGEWANGMRHGRGVVNKPNFYLYDGKWSCDKRHGNGTCTYADKNKYTGNWNNDHRDGEGVFIWANGESYTGSFKDDILTGFGTKRYNDRGVYTGAWVNWQRCGNGKLTSANKDICEGLWRNDKMNGDGKITWADGSFYEGSFIDHKLTGQGTKRYLDGMLYVGQWRDAKRHGNGVLTWRNGDKYEGEFVDDEITGKGTKTYADRTVYVGEWVNGNRQGKGKLTWSNGEVYEGDFSNDIITGSGNKMFKDKSTYNGAWENGVRHGEGTITHLNGHRYSGNWANDKRNGYGNCVYSSRDKYEGEWLHDKRHGNGKYTWPNGDSYQGAFRNDAMEGQGVYHYTDGRVCECTWLNDKKNGVGKYTWPNGDVFEGTFKNDIMVLGTLTYTDGVIYKGEFKNGLKHGKGSLKLPTGDICDGIFIDNVFTTGTLTTSTEEVFSGSFNDMKLHGRGKQIWSHKASFEGEFANGIPCGRGSYKYANGVTVDNIHVNKLPTDGINSIKIFSNGDVYEGQWKKSKKHGKGKYTWPNGGVYEGDFYEDDFCGYGVKHFADGHVYQGNWFKDVKHGRGVLTLTTGDKYEGEFKHDLMNGHGCMQYVDGSVYEGERLNNKRHGNGKLTKHDKTIQEGRWHNDVYVPKGWFW